MEEKYLAHISEDGREQTVKEHLQNTARLCGMFAAAFGAEEQGRLAGLAHDIGKYSKEFQQRLHGGPSMDHATAGAAACAQSDQLYAAYCAMGHHSGLPDFGSGDDIAENTFQGRLRRGMAGGICDCSGWEGEIRLPNAALPDFCGNDRIADMFFIRMLYSCLVDADYLDTEAFMKGAPVPRGEKMDAALLNSLLDGYIGKWFPPKGELNERRCAILEACMKSGEKYEPGLFTLTVPAGGGKTMASLAFALRHAKAWDKRRIIYVIPYTSIVEQTADVFRDVLGGENVLEHHSGVRHDFDWECDLVKMRVALAAENWDMPVVVTTAVQFFESLYANRGAKCRKLHNIAGSIIIFDEAQMIPLPYLRPCISAIAQLVENYGATAVLCTATQPALDRIFSEYLPGICPVELCPRELTKVFERVTFRREGRLRWDALAEHMNGEEQALCIVNSRSNAQTLFKLLQEDGRFHLSTLMAPVHRRAVLETIRMRLRDRKPCQVVSTSLIEAGVDVDFGTVFREEAGLDSVLQAAGRCNREGKRSAAESIVHIFEAETKPPEIFAGAIAAGRMVMDTSMELTDPEVIRLYFQNYMYLRGDFAQDMKEILKRIQSGSFPFETIAGQFRLIEDDTKTIYIPIGEGKDLIQKLLRGDLSRGLMRKLGQYGVSVYEKHFQTLWKSGDVELLEDGNGVLRTLALYSAETGLRFSEDAGEEEFI